ncbi:putative non-heme bromoperoxidase BpoC [Streptomyces sp. ADI96-02]|uniref:alpha/beta fold hydrolase n=1 Tax=Streptomyces sp. ADI96-02 TaxID=1522760 RepID=UPI000F54D3F8|nr:alpha/beta fold hydrolase [Streptomyces sp. ADI96-02]RPK54508.1 putative non-heme bromoperoxidase BpoC [Streptomyces sp. ADI96-02]
MPTALLNGITVSYDDTGAGEPVVLVNGTGVGRTVWRARQTPALVAAGYRVIALDNRGLPPNTQPPGGITLDTMAGDVAALIDHLRLAPCRIVGYSLGASVVAELLLTRPGLVRQAVMMAGRARPDPFGTAYNRAARDLIDGGATVPASHRAVFSALSYLSPHTLRDPRAAQDWLDVFTYAQAATGPGIRAQYDAVGPTDRLPRYAAIDVPLLCVGFADDVMIPPAATREIADTVPGARYTEIERCGHYGHLERPAEVNAVLLDFFAGKSGGAARGTS